MTRGSAAVASTTWVVCLCVVTHPRSLTRSLSLLLCCRVVVLPCCGRRRPPSLCAHATRKRCLSPFGLCACCSLFYSRSLACCAAAAAASACVIHPRSLAHSLGVCLCCCVAVLLCCCVRAESVVGCDATRKRCACRCGSCVLISVHVVCMYHTMPTLFALSADAVRVSTDVIHASARVFHASARVVRKPRQRGSHCFVLTPAARHTLIFVHMLPFSCHIFAKTTRRAMSARGVRFSARAVHLSSRVGHTSAHTLFGRRPVCGACVEECRVAARARHAPRPLASSVLEYRVSRLLVQAVLN